MGELERLPCAIKLLPNPTRTMGFHDFDQYERLLAAARKRSAETYLMVLLGGDAGLRLGNRRAGMARHRTAGTPAHCAAIRLVGSRHRPHGRPVGSAADDAVIHGGAEDGSPLIR